MTVPSANIGSTVKRRIEYARTRDGANIAFWTLGEGTPFVHLTPGTTDIEGEWKMPECRDWYGRLSERFKLVRFNNRGEISPLHPGDSLLETCVADLEAVVDRLALDRFVLFGPWYGGPPAITYAARHPERVSHLILLCTFARGADWSNQPQLKAVRSLVDKDWSVYTEAVASTMLGWAEGGRAPLCRGPARQRDARICAESLRAGEYLDVSALLTGISTPTLVIRRQHLLGADVARRSPRVSPARLVILGRFERSVPGRSTLFGTIEEFTATVGAPAAKAPG
jgi:pimeloyl-ACP methyl ester carboxylesterase